MSQKQDRRTFIKKAGVGAVGLTLGMSAKSYANIIGANDRINFAAAGIRGRGKALIRAAAAQKNTALLSICDVDSREFDITNKLVRSTFGNTAKTYADIRKMLENKDIDALLIASPDHWHAPMALMGMQADKHVYVEKPCSHNPREGELLVKAQKKYGKVVQMGNQQRSAPTSQQGVKAIREGIIGDVYFGKAWYSNNRGSIGVGKKVAIPEWLDWELFQGPAPRTPFKDNYVHYNWHWFWNFGTGEINNNGTHEIDICRWALGVEIPNRVSSSGGRYHFQDDWEFYDTQIVNFEYEGGKMITWEGFSCNGHQQYNRGRGALVRGTKGSMMLDRNGVIAYDLAGKVVLDLKEEAKSGTIDTVGAGALDTYHMTNFINGIKVGEKLAAPIDDGATSNLHCHLGNISQKLGRSLEVNPKNGRMKDKQAMKYWARDYEPGWEMKV